MNRSDIRHIKQLADRLEVRESDVIRFAIKIMLEQLTPLQDPKATGRSLLPVFMGLGVELMRHFELDAGQLAAIINDGVEDERRVEPDDIQLIAMTGTHRSYPHLVRAPAHHDGGGPNHGENETLEKTLRRYFYEKYLHNATLTPNGPGTVG